MKSKTTRSRILLIGLGPTTLSALESLVPRFEVVLARSSETNAPRDPALEFAKSHDLKIISDTSLKAVKKGIIETRPECAVISSYNRIVPASWLKRLGFLNVHYALLPEYRGRANVNWAILNGEEATGITIHQVVRELDAGPILYQKSVPIRDTDTVTTLYQRLNDLQREVLAETIRRFLSGETGKPQDDRRATYGCGRNPEDGEIDWAEPTSCIDRQVRALTPPFPGTFSYLEGRRLQIWRVETVKQPPVYRGRIPGRVVARSGNEGFVDILTGDGILRLREVQLEGEEKKAAAKVIRSTRTTLGLRSTDILRRIEALERRGAR